MKNLPLESIAVIGIRLLGVGMIATALVCWIHAALSESFTIRQLPDHLAESGIELRVGEATAQTAAILGATGIFILVLSRGLGRWLAAGLND